MKFIQKRDLSKATCSLCRESAKYVVNIPYPISDNKEDNKDYKFGMRLRVNLCGSCVRKLYELGCRLT